jgi:hypothetical protein
MTGGSWPFLPAQCPHCFYFRALAPPFTDDSGYRILGFCSHPRIGMELFELQRLDPSKGDLCGLFVRRVARHPHST